MMMMIMIHPCHDWRVVPILLFLLLMLPSPTKSFLRVRKLFGTQSLLGRHAFDKSTQSLDRFPDPHPSPTLVSLATTTTSWRLTKQKQKQKQKQSSTTMYYNLSEKEDVEEEEGGGWMLPPNTTNDDDDDRTDYCSWISYPAAANDRAS
jgi:hypothetical protein